jgi:hypothetical protein
MVMDVIMGTWETVPKIAIIEARAAMLVETTVMTVV